MQDYLYQLSGNASINLSGLAPYSQYDLYLYTQNNDSNGREAVFTVNGISQQSGVGSQGESAWVQGVNYTLYQDVFANGLGNLNISFNPGVGFAGEADVNGLQLKSVPEPASLVLFGLVRPAYLRSPVGAAVGPDAPIPPKLAARF